jgi:hypothetical protein
MAICHRQLKVAKGLLEDGASPTEQDNDGRTPLHFAAQFGVEDVAEALIAKNADTNAKDRFGCSPLHLAAEKGHMNLVDLLLSAGADVHARANYGTARDAAEANGHRAVARRLEYRASAKPKSAVFEFKIPETQVQEWLSQQPRELLDQVRQELPNLRHDLFAVMYLCAAQMSTQPELDEKWASVLNTTGLDTVIEMFPGIFGSSDSCGESGAILHKLLYMYALGQCVIRADGRRYVLRL